MKLRIHDGWLRRGAALAQWGWWLGLTLPVLAAPLVTNAPPGKPVGAAATNSLPAQPPIPRSVFVVPRAASEGRDPFYPESTRGYAVAPAATKAAAPSAAAHLDELRLMGLYGQVGKRLAIINKITMAAGEEAYVPVSGSRVRIRCLEIKDNSVVVQAGKAQRELRLRNGF